MTALAPSTLRIIAKGTRALKTQLEKRVSDTDVISGCVSVAITAVRSRSNALITTAVAELITLLREALDLAASSGKSRDIVGNGCLLAACVDASGAVMEEENAIAVLEDPRVRKAYDDLQASTVDLDLDLDRDTKFIRNLERGTRVGFDELLARLHSRRV
jgi:hypothetical protein